MIVYAVEITNKVKVGSRYTVRGFDGELSLSSERGWYVQNDLAWHYRPTHRIYLGVDYGHVSGPTVQYLLGQNLSGGVVGLKGQFKAGGDWYYDVFAGKSLHKPEYFRVGKKVYGFNVNYTF